MDFSNAVNAGQILVLVGTIITNIVSLTVIIMVIKSDVRSLREGQTRQADRLTKIEAAMDKQTDILVKQTKQEVEIEFLKSQIEELAKAHGNSTLVRYIGNEVPRHAPQLPEDQRYRNRDKDR